jgi:hypothetical protein
VALGSSRAKANSTHVHFSGRAGTTRTGLALGHVAWYMRNPTGGSPAVRCVCGAATFTTRFDFVIKDPVAPSTHPFWLHFGEDGAQVRGRPPRGDAQTGQLTLV